MRKPYTRWTHDTETAFLLALRSTGTVRAAAGAIGRAVGSAYKRRQRVPDFAARWDAAVREWQAAWIAEHGDDATRAETGDRPRERWDGWSAVRKRAFLRALSETGEVRTACERVGMTHSAVYRLKARSPDFARECERAVARSLPNIEQVAWERAVEGWDEEVVVGGKVTGTRRRYSETLLRTLLTAELTTRRGERVAAAKIRPVYKTATREETDKTLNTILDRLDRKKRHGLMIAEERWLEVQAAGGFPWAAGINSSPVRGGGAEGDGGGAA